MQPTEVVEINRQIRRVLAGNPSPMTGPGTNSYLIGRGGGVLVLDPGPNLPPHRAAILSALAPGEWIEAIVVSHAHADHSAGAPDLARASGAPVFAFGPAAAGRSPVMAQLAAQGLVAGGEGVDHAFQPDRLVADGAVLKGDWGEVEVIHTPGHMAGHLCLAHQGVLFSGDHAMGWSSSLVSPPDGDMADYMASLRRLSARHWRMMLPGHGPAVEEATVRLAALLAHRQSREGEVLAALADGPADAATLARRLYRDLSPRLRSAAERNVLAHLIDLWSRNRIKAADLPRLETIFHL